MNSKTDLLLSLAKSVGECILVDPESVRPYRFDPDLFEILSYSVTDKRDDVFFSLYTCYGRGWGQKTHHEQVDYLFKKGSQDWFELEGLLESIKQHLDLVSPTYGKGYTL